MQIITAKQAVEYDGPGQGTIHEITWVDAAEPGADPLVTLVRHHDGACALVCAGAEALALAAAHLGEESVAELRGRTFAVADDTGDFQAGFDDLVGRARCTSSAPLARVTLILTSGGWMSLLTWSEYLGKNGEEWLYHLLDEALFNAPVTGGACHPTTIRGETLVLRTNVWDSCSASRDIDVLGTGGTTLRLNVRVVVPPGERGRRPAYWLDGISGSWPDPSAPRFITR